MSILYPILAIYWIVMSYATVNICNNILYFNGPDSFGFICLNLIVFCVCLLQIIIPTLKD